MGLISPKDGVDWFEFGTRDDPDILCSLCNSIMSGDSITKLRSVHMLSLNSQMNAILEKDEMKNLGEVAKESQCPSLLTLWALLCCHVGVPPPRAALDDALTEFRKHRLWQDVKIISKAQSLCDEREAEATQSERETIANIYEALENASKILCAVERAQDVVASFATIPENTDLRACPISVSPEKILTTPTITTSILSISSDTTKFLGPLSLERGSPVPPFAPLKLPPPRTRQDL